jgi:nondiscriminating glutamyl-tRNA synthetase
MSSSPRVRFAPSPTGHLHIGNVRTAILNWLFARHANGAFILRIEDTDEERSTRESEQSILEDLRWLGLSWDEGVEVGGAFGPYRQSERLPIYHMHTERLLKEGKAYHCYCTPEELEARRALMLESGQAPKYDGRCRKLTSEERRAYEREGRKPAIRFVAPEKEVRFVDLVKGEVAFPPESQGDFVLVRSDGLPTYNYACVIDDHLMEISHVIRGDDHVSNTPKQVVIYEAFGWSPLQVAHIPMILGPDRQRLSKRHGATSVDAYANKGYLPAALINYLSLLSWSSESGEEILSIERLIKEFDLSRVTHAAAIFDVAKLNWMNGVYIRSLPMEALLAAMTPYLQSAGYKIPEPVMLSAMVALVKDGLEYLEQSVEKLEMFFVEAPSYSSAEAQGVLKRENAQKIFWSFLRAVDEYERLDASNFRAIMKHVQSESGVMGRDLWMPIRVALTGQIHGPELPMVAQIFGKEKCRRLVQKALQVCSLL